VEQALSDPNVKQTLRANTEWAIERGVFGVPTFVVDDEIFWGHDALDMMLEYIRNPKSFRNNHHQQGENLATAHSSAVICKSSAVAFVCQSPY
jgi:predicted DsbA family dithiol-disulfide isomerase